MDASSRTEALAAARSAIDKTDAELLQLLNHRAQLSLEVGHIKRQTNGEQAIAVYDPKREQELLSRLIANNKGPLSEGHIRDIWAEILSVSRSLQHRQSVAYLGPEGTFSYFAGMEFLGHAAEYRPCANFDEIFRHVQEGVCELGIIPLENSLQGTVGPNFDLLWQYDVEIRAEFLSRISHCLLSPENDLDAVHIIYSHPQPLAQCGHWLRERCPKATLVPVESTAAAAARSAHEPASAAIGHVSLGSRLGLHTLAVGIEDDPANWTRFVLITARNSNAFAAAGNADKTSLMFTLPDRAGALAAVLDVLASGSVNMRKLESRPMGGTCWKYIFFADVECDLSAQKYGPLIERLRDSCLSFRILGSYPSGLKSRHNDTTGDD